MYTSADMHQFGWYMNGVKAFTELDNRTHYTATCSEQHYTTANWSYNRFIIVYWDSILFRIQAPSFCL